MNIEHIRGNEEAFKSAVVTDVALSVGGRPDKMKVTHLEAMEVTPIENKTNSEDMKGTQLGAMETTHCEAMEVTPIENKTNSEDMEVARIGAQDESLSQSSGVATRGLVDGVCGEGHPCNTSPHTTTHCNALQHTTRCSTLVTLVLEEGVCGEGYPLETVVRELEDQALDCQSRLRQVGVTLCCNTLQHNTTRCNTLQHNATHCTSIKLLIVS